MKLFTLGLESAAKLDETVLAKQVTTFSREISSLSWEKERKGAEERERRTASPLREIFLHSRDDCANRESGASMQRSNKMQPDNPRDCQRKETTTTYVCISLALRQRCWVNSAFPPLRRGTLESIADQRHRQCCSIFSKENRRNWIVFAKWIFLYAPVFFFFFYAHCVLLTLSKLNLGPEVSRTGQDPVADPRQLVTFVAI